MPLMTWKHAQCSGMSLKHRNFQSGSVCVDWGQRSKGQERVSMYQRNPLRWQKNSRVKPTLPLPHGCLGFACWVQEVGAGSVHAILATHKTHNCQAIGNHSSKNTSAAAAHEKASRTAVHCLSTPLGAHVPRDEMHTCLIKTKWDAIQLYSP